MPTQPTDPAARRAAALARIKVVPRRLTRHELARIAHALAGEKGITFFAALAEVRTTARTERDPR